ncbi:MAG: hypothetical protein MJ025_02240 [Victivallaceae bacterium]|nr:hypothetical protein [Victivallaceae bacterium]
MSLAGAVVFLTGVLFATQTFWSGLLYREALLAKSVTERQRFAAASIDVMETARARYVNGVSLLDLLRFQESAFEFERMHDHIVPRGYVHSFAYEARARASLGDFKKAMELLDKERHRYPHSVTCQYFILKAAVDSQADILVIDTESRRLDELMQERHLNRSMISEIVLSPELDDEGMIFRF